VTPTAVDILIEVAKKQGIQLDASAAEAEIAECVEGYRRRLAFSKGVRGSKRRDKYEKMLEAAKVLQRGYTKLLNDTVFADPMLYPSTTGDPEPLDTEAARAEISKMLDRITIHQRWLTAAVKTARREVKRGNPGNRSVQTLIWNLGNVYEKHTGRKPGTSHSSAKDAQRGREGPFVRFVEAVFSEAGMPERYALGQTVRNALARRKEAYRAFGHFLAG
jgi:hypothetical protein